MEEGVRVGQGGRSKVMGLRVEEPQLGSRMKRGAVLSRFGRV